MNKDDDHSLGFSLTILASWENTQGIVNLTSHTPPPSPSPLNSGGVFLFPMLTIIDLFLGNWSGIKATFTFERMASYFFIHVYGPCALIVIISWVSFLLPRSSPPARVTLGVTSVLTVVTILNMLNNSMPKVFLIYF